MDKKGNSSPSMLILFIATLITIIIVVGVLVSKAGDYTSKSGTIKKANEEYVSTHLEFKEVSAQNGLNGYLNNFSIVVEPSQGSIPINLDNLIITVISDSGNALLSHYSSNSPGILNNSGFNTWNVEQIGAVNSTDLVMLQEDYDDDHRNDYVIVLNESHIQFNLSAAGLFNYSLGNVNLTNSSGNPQTLSVAKTQIGDSIVYGYFLISGTSNMNMTIPQNVNFTVYPKEIGKGYFTTEFVGFGKDHVAGAIYPNDAVRIYFETNANIYINENFIINLIPEKSLRTSINLYASELSKERKVYFPVSG